MAMSNYDWFGLTLILLTTAGITWTLARHPTLRRDVTAYWRPSAAAQRLKRWAKSHRKAN